MRSISFALTVFAVFVLVACGSGGTITVPGDFDRAAEITAMITRHNNTRAAHGVNALGQDALLNQIAQTHAQYMASSGNMSHADAQGLHVDGRATAVGYNWNAIGENIGYDTSSQHLYNGWLGSQDHFDNIVDPDFEDIGVGVVTTGIYEYWCIVFGRD